MFSIYGSKGLLSNVTLVAPTNVPEGLYTGAAVGIRDSANVTMLNCIFENHRGHAWGGALTLDRNASAYIKNSKFLNNSARAAGAVWIKNSGNVTFENNLFFNNTAVPGSKEPSSVLTSAQAQQLYRGGAIYMMNQVGSYECNGCAVRFKGTNNFTNNYATL